MNVECTGQCFRSSPLLSYNVPIPLLHCIFEIIYTDYTPRLHLGQCLCQIIETSCESFREKTRLRDSRESQTKTPCQSTCIKASFLFESHDRSGGVAQWLGRRISDQGVPGSNPGRCTFRCGLEQVTFTLLSTG